MNIVEGHKILLVKLLAAVWLALGASTASAQVQTQKLTASDAYPGQKFGDVVAADGEWIAVGVADDDQMAAQAGAVYMFHREAGSFVQSQKLFAADAQSGDLFGAFVDLAPDLMVVGAPYEDPGAFAAGSAYVFERTRGAWLQTSKLVATTPYPNSFFGYAVVTDGVRIVAGAREELGRGAAYVFERVGGMWTQVSRLTASDGDVWDLFGVSVAVAGDTVLVGSAADGPGGSSQGAAYVFEFNGVNWSQTQKLYSSDGTTSNAFSFYMALDGSRTLISAYTHNHQFQGSGSVYAFDRLGSLWSETQEIRAHAPSTPAGFGGAIAMVGDLAIAGAATESLTVDGGGASYVLRINGAAWEQVGRLLPNDVEYGDAAGGRVAFNGSHVVVGSPRDDDVCPTVVSCNSGSVYVFEIAPDARQFGWCMNSAPCGNTFSVGGCRNSTNLGSRLAAAGSSSVALDELRFEVRDMQPNKNAILFMGAGIGQAVLGDGLRVVASGGTGFYRFGVSTAGADGSFQRANVISHSQSFAPTGRIQPGSVWNFQCWHRDPAGPCGSGTNLTNAVEVTFRP